jgi:sec-independent protein translocase protein TatA
MSVGPGELVVILLVVMLLFGSRLGDLGKGIGDAIRGFKRGIAGETADNDAAKRERPQELPAARGAAQAELGEADRPASAPTDPHKPD